MSSKKRGNEPWRSTERHYCALCNAWMGSDKQSILIHENGKKHQENVEASMKKRREDKLKAEKEKDKFDASLKLIHQIASSKYSSNDDNSNSNNNVAASGFVPLSTSTCVPVMNNNNRFISNDGASNKRQEKSMELNSWQQRKDKREEQSRNKQHTEDDPDKLMMIDHSNSKVIPKQRRTLGDDEGHYTIGSVTYLKGSVYAPIFEEDMPVQIWTGSATMTEEYKNSLEANYLWKLGLIINISNISKKTDENNTPGDCDNIICTVSYLKDLNDVDETIEKNVSPNRIRLILGSDPMIPTTIEEAHLALIGGEEIIQIQTTNDNSSSILQQHQEQQPQQPEIDENTGLSTWGTVSIRNVSIHHELKEERARIRAQRKAESEREKQKEKEKEARLMEEAKHANADDSALGAYDVWSTTTTTTANNGKGGGYKGVNIHSEVKIDISDTAKSLSEGKVNVQFKKRKDGNGGSSSSFKKVKKVQNQRKTFADDDDE